MKIEFAKWWFRINGYGFSITTYNLFSVRNGYLGKFSQWTQKHLGFHFRKLTP